MVGHAHRGAAALARIGPSGLREIGIGFGFAFVGASLWSMVAAGNRREWETANREFQVKKEAKRKAFEAWLAAQPYDDEVTAAKA